MEFETQNSKSNRLVDVNKEETCYQKKKTKGKKELWGTLLQVYEKEKHSKPIAKESELQNTLLTQEGNQHKDCNKIKSKKKTKSRQSKNALTNHSNVSADKPLSEKGRDKITHKNKSSSKYFQALSRFSKEENNAPLVILHHRGEKPFQKSKERICVDSKHHMSPNRSQVAKNFKAKKINEPVDNDQSKCKEKYNDTNSLRDIKPNRDKIKNRIVKSALSETPNATAEPKHKIKKIKHSKQVLPVDDTTSNANDYTNQMKSLPIHIENNPLTFMNLFRTAHIFNGHKNHKKFDDVMKLYCEKLKQEDKSIPKDSSIPNLNEGQNKMNNAEPLRKPYINKRTSSKFLKGEGSRKRFKKFKNKSVLLDDPKKYSLQDDHENIPESLNSLKCRTEFRRKRTKCLTSENQAVNNILVTKLENLPSKEKFNVNTIKINKNTLHNDDFFKVSSKYFRPECGDGLVGEFSSQPSSQNNKLSTIYSESIEMTEKDSTGIDQLNVDSTNLGQFEILSKSNTTLQNNDSQKCGSKNPIKSKDVGKVSILKPTVSEDGKKLTFQLVKADLVPKNISKLNKQTNRLDKKRLIKANKERLSVNKNKLMLFYEKRESSFTSKDSLNIAISRDTETSNNGSSNKVLNVVIKQTNSLLSNSNTSPRRDFELEKEGPQGINDLKFQRKNIYDDGFNKSFYGNVSEEFGCQTYDKAGLCMLAGNQAESFINATNSHEVDSKQSIIFYETDADQYKCLTNSEFGFCCLQHSPEENNEMTFKNGLVKKVLNLKSFPKTSKITQLPQNMFVPESNYLKNSKIACVSPQTTELTLKEQKQNNSNSPKRNKFYTVFNPNGETESLTKGNAQIGYKKTTNGMTYLVNNKHTHNVDNQSEQINNKKICSNNQQNPKDQENLELKLQVIGLTQKKSFVKVIESEIVEGFMNENKIVNTAKISGLQNKERNAPLLVKNDNKESKNNYYIPTNQKNTDKPNICSGEDIKNKLSIFKMEKPVQDSWQIEPNEESNKDSSGDDVPMVMKKCAIIQELSLCNFVKNDVTQNKDNFVAVLPAVENDVVESNGNLETRKPTNLKDQVAKNKEEPMVYSEIGVQTDFPITPCRKKVQFLLTKF